MDLTKNIHWLDKSMRIASYSDYSDGLLRVKKGWSYGYTDLLGGFVIPPVYEHLGSWCCGLAWASIGGQHCYINRSNQVVIPGDKFYVPSMYSVGDISDNGLVRVGTPGHENRKWGFVDTSGNMVIDLVYDDAGSFSNGLSAVGKDGLYGYIDATGKNVIGYRYERASAFSGRLAVVCRDKLYGVINTDGKEIIPPRYEFLMIYWGCRVAVRHEDKWGIFDENGTQITSFEYDDITAYNCDGYAEVGKDGKKGLIDKTGKLIIPLLYRDVSYPTEGFAEAAVGKRGKTFVGIDGREMPARFDDVLFGFTEGLAAVKKRRKWGYIDTGGAEVIPPQYADVTGFHGGIARVMDSDGKCGYINRNNEAVIPLEYDWMSTFDDRPVATVTSGFNPVFKKYGTGVKHGLIDRENNLLLPVIFDEVLCTDDVNIVLVLLNNQWGILKL